MWSRLVLLAIAMWPAPAVPLFIRQCVEPDALTDVALTCHDPDLSSGEPSDKYQILVRTAFLGKVMWTINCFTLETPVSDCHHSAANQTELFRSSCNTRRATCTTQVYYDTADERHQCSEEHNVTGTTYVYVQYECLPVSDMDGNAAVIINPMADHPESISQQYEVNLQSALYPDDGQYFNQAQCKINIPERDVIRISVYDLSYSGVTFGVPYCLKMEDYVGCAEKGQDFLQVWIFESMTLNFTINFTPDVEIVFHSRFWIHLTGLTWDYRPSNQMNVTCNAGLSSISVEDEGGGSMVGLGIAVGILLTLGIIRYCIVAVIMWRRWPGEVAVTKQKDEKGKLPDIPAGTRQSVLGIYCELGDDVIYSEIDENQATPSSGVPADAAPLGLYLVVDVPVALHYARPDSDHYQSLADDGYQTPVGQCLHRDCHQHHVEC